LDITTSSKETLRLGRETSSREMLSRGREGRISPYHEMLLLNWRPTGEGGKLVSKLVLMRSPSYQVLAHVLVPKCLVLEVFPHELAFS
jgi:hypothetical protein